MLDFFGIGTKRASAGQVSIYPARVGQAVDCARIHAAAFANAWSETELESMLLAANTIGDCAAIALNNCVAGFVLSRLVADEAEIMSIAVDPAYRRSGIARRLLLSHLGRAAGAGAQKIFLEVDCLNVAALGLYRSLGFAEVGHRRAYYRNNDGTFADALVLRCNLL